MTAAATAAAVGYREVKGLLTVAMFFSVGAKFKPAGC
jgi:hypothetical protein